VPTKFAVHRSPELRRQYDALPLFGEPNDQAAKQIVAAYHAAARYADAQVGRVLKALENTDAAANTIVVLMGDHGFLLGQYKMWTKHALFEAALRTPLIIADPRWAQSGNPGEVTAVTDLLDVYPTLADLAGLTAPDHLDGVSLRPFLTKTAQNDRPEKLFSVSRWQNGESIRTRDYRYTRWFSKDNETLAEMLFDLTNDPAETTNLVDYPELSVTIQELRERLSRDRRGEVWSEALGSSVNQWNLVTSSVGGLLIAALTYPISTLIIAVLLLVILLAAVRLLWRRRRITL